MKKKSSGDQRKRAQIRLQNWMTNFYDAEWEDDPFWLGAPYIEVPKVDVGTPRMRDQVQILERLNEELGEPPAGFTRRWALIYKHPFRSDSSIFRHKLDLAIPSGEDRIVWTESSETGLEESPHGSLRAQFDANRAARNA